MQNFALNGGELNGDPKVWIDDSSANVVFQAAGEGMRGIVLDGAAPVVLASSLSLALQAKLEGSAAFHVEASGALMNGLSLAGSAPVVVQASGEAVRWAMLQGYTPTVVALDGDIAVVPSISATFSVVFGGDLDLKVATGQHIVGYLPVVLKAGFEAYSVPATRLEGFAGVQFAGIGQGILLITSPPGSASIQFKANGDGRFGAKILLEGSAEIGFYARGYLGSWHYVYAEGYASIDVLARAEKHGTPIIPGYYVEAPAIRALRVGEETRRFNVAAERRV